MRCALTTRAFYQDVCLPLKLWAIFSVRASLPKMSHWPDLVDQHCRTGKAFARSFDYFGNWASLDLTK